MMSGIRINLFSIATLSPFQTFFRPDIVKTSFQNSNCKVEIALKRAVSKIALFVSSLIVQQN